MLGVNTVAFSPDGRLLATSADDLSVRAVDTVAFSPDGRLLATSADDLSVREMELESVRKMLV
ncbi:hypothetical protein T484DRAFT_1846717 [Baffinella frigidus]|nr:hypothetical protein T484DRAFT_1846717 [Cryptophyta sp. CCMP2293]